MVGEVGGDERGTARAVSVVGPLVGFSSLDALKPTELAKKAEGRRLRPTDRLVVSQLEQKKTNKQKTNKQKRERERE